MGRRSRHTAKTGDGAIYKRRGNVDDDDDNDGERRRSKVRSNRGDDYDENMYDEVDDYHNRREADEEEEFMKLNDGDGGGRRSKEEEEEGIDDGIVHNREAVFDLGIGASSSSSEDEDEEDSEDDSEDGRYGASAAAAGSSSRDEDGSSSSDSSSSDDDEMGGDGEAAGAALDSVLDWGRNRRNYYHGDTADLEIGQHIEDAELEEEAGREVQKARYEKMDEDDFLADFDVGKDKKRRQQGGGGESDLQAGSTGTALLSSGDGLGSLPFDDVERLPSTSKASDAGRRDKIARLSTEDKLKLLRKQSPELLPLISHFQSTALLQLTEKIVPVMEQLSDATQAEAVGATDGGLSYLRQKQMVGVSTVLNLIMYLLLKLEQQQQQQQDDNDGDGGLDIKSHPVIARLNALSGLDERLRAKIEGPFGLGGQLDALTKAAALMKEGRRGLDDEMSSSSSSSSSESASESEESRGSAEKSGESTQAGGPLASGGGKVGAHSTSSPSSSEDEDDSAAMERDAMNEARFAVRSHDFDDGRNRKAAISLRDKRKQRRAKEPETSVSRNKTRMMTATEYDYGDEDVQAHDGLNASKKLSAIMNAITQREKVSAGRRRAAPLGGDTENDIDGDDRLQRGLDMMEEMLGKASDDDEDGLEGVSDAELDNDDEGADEFYNTIKRRATAKKERKKSIYQVAPKYPSLEEEIDGERGIGRMIMKNRGLVPHKSKLNRNPRVKKREQYRKALIRRKGAVREVRTDEVDTYGGEATGIKSSISRSRKL